jgi:soluble lytic murein transglycosylase
MRIKPFTPNKIVSLYGLIVRGASNAYGVSPSLIFAVIEQESGGNPLAVGLTGDFGLMQVTAPALADYNGAHKSQTFSILEMFSITKNIAVGSWYLSYLKKYFNGDETKAVRAYNAGMGNVSKNKDAGSKYAQSVFARQEKYRGFENV